MTLLQQTLTSDNLHSAWHDVADNKGIAGVDNVSIKQWRRTWRTRLHKLAHAVRTSTYKPLPLRHRRIPKKAPGQWRDLRIPTVTDRVLQRAVYQTLLPIIEPQFLPCSFGYRPAIGIHNAVAAIQTHRRAGLTHVLDADIDDFFNQVDHSHLIDQVTEALPDQSLHHLLRLWIAQADIHKKKRGIPMGSPISPLLANLYLNHFDQRIDRLGYAMVRYADDFIVLCPSVERVEQAYRDVAQQLDNLKLRYEPSKTTITDFDTGFDFLGVHFEETWYWYIYEGKRIEIGDDDVDWYLHNYLPDY